MPILEKIQDAEKVAEKLKLEAKEKVVELIENKTNENNLLIKQKLDDAHKQIDNLNANTNVKIQELAKELEIESLNINRQDEELAQTHLDETIDFIIKKVITS